ncbi:hypothetical protein H312_03053 [Anncaliia algerae PRA339]|uniref:ISXO2-like transposase domain-containing protein n=1 Tax=Anncaliia algerae PRA339 TaxID=1288291 RepID=A0A059EXF0_9MICR|nr:hypothetical protein H312_03053 [Anncaliia algerae PRA339]
MVFTKYPSSKNITSRERGASKVIYGILINLTYYQIKNFIHVSDATITKTKKLLRNAFKKYSEDKFIPLGGNKIFVECDETVISRRGIIWNPISTDDRLRDTIWILGSLLILPPETFFLKRIPDRTIVTITRALEEKVLINSIFTTDGHPSYPRVAEHLHLHHNVVNHSEGFINSEGIHTNNIEGFWSHLKSELRRQGVVMRRNIDDWIEDFSFRRKYLKIMSRIE